MPRNPLGSEPARSSRDSSPGRASSWHGAGITPKMRTEVELVSPSDDVDGDDDDAMGIGRKGRGPLGVLGDCPPTNDAVCRAGEVTAVRSSSRRPPGPPSPADSDWVALARPPPAGMVGEPAETAFPAPLAGAVGETGATRRAGGPTTPTPTGAAPLVTGARTVAARLDTGARPTAANHIGHGGKGRGGEAGHRSEDRGGEAGHRGHHRANHNGHGGEGRGGEAGHRGHHRANHNGHGGEGRGGEAGHRSEDRGGEAGHG